jgi:predicted secreted protein
MASYVNGTDLRFYKDGVAIGEATSCSMDLSLETRETLTKDNVGSWVRNEAGRRSGTLQAEGLVSYDTTNESVSDLFTTFENGDVVIIRFTTGDAATPYWEASAICTGLSISAAVEENSTYSASFAVNGAVTLGTV